MSLENGILRSIRSDLTKIESKLLELTRELEVKETFGARKEYTETMLEYDTLAHRELNYLYKEQSARRYAEGLRPGRYLARLIRQMQAPLTITQVCDTTGRILKDTDSIGEAFRDYYENIYSDSTPIPVENAADYLEDISLAWASDIDRKLLNDPITIQEIEEAISDLQTGKAPGPDGLGAEFYKAHKKFLAPI